MTKGRRRKDNKSTKVLKTSLYILFILAAVLFVRYFCIMRTVVDGVSMEPALSDGDNLLVDELSYRIRKPARFDIAVIPDRERGGYIIKRVIGLPGESIEIEEGRVKINGSFLMTDIYGAEPILDPGILSDGPLILAADEYFVLGDNRNESADSRIRDIGPIRRKALSGRAILRLTPLKHFGTLKK